MRGSPKRSAVVLCGRNLRASPFDRVETKNLCLLVSYMPLAFIPAATRTLRPFKDRQNAGTGSVGLREAPPSPLRSLTSTRATHLPGALGVVMRAAPRIALLCLTLPRAFLAADTADIDFLNLQGDIRIAKKERQNLERKVDAQNGDLARRLEAALADRQAIKTQLSMLQAQIHGLQAEVQSLAAAATSGGGGGPPGELMMPPPGNDAIV